MQTTRYDIAEEPSGLAYSAVLDFCTSRAATFSLVVRGGLSGPGAAAFLDSYRPHLIGMSAESAWPGTVLGAGQTAILYRYRVCTESIRLLRERCDRLYAWLAPALPEDLAMYRDDGSVLLGTTAHERDGWLALRKKEETAGRSLEIPLVRSGEQPATNTLNE